MRWILKKILFHLLALFLAARLIPGFSIGNSFEAIGLATVILTIINVFIKPIVRLFFFPLNLLTLNLFSIVINSGIIFALTKFVPTVTISAWYFKGININGFVIPALEVGVIYTYVVVAVLITSIVDFLNWLIK